jgi:hypothetical protein
MKIFTLTAVLTLTLSSLFAQKKIHDSTLVFGKWIYTDRATGKQWGGDDAVVSKQWNVRDNRDQLTYGELYLNNTTRDTLRNVVFFFVLKGIKDAMEIRTVDTTTRIITCYKPADIVGFHIAQASVFNNNNDTGMFFSVTKKGLQTMTDGKMDIAQMLLWSPRVILAESLGSSYTPYYYKFAGMKAFDNVPQFGDMGIVYKFKNKFAKVFESCPEMQKMVKDKNYSQDRAGMVAAFTDYLHVNCPDNAAAASN